jgi:hypothetical protein
MRTGTMALTALGLLAIVRRRDPRTGRHGGGPQHVFRYLDGCTGQRSKRRLAAPHGNR